MKTKEQKLAQLDKYIERLGVSCENVIKHLQSTSVAMKVFSKTDYASVRPGMFWYEDDTFSFKRVSDKKIKAIVELVESGIIYGDLTASELFDVPEIHMCWSNAKKFLKKFSYPCRENEKIVWYNIDQLQSVYRNYNAVEKAFNVLWKPCRSSVYWSSTEYECDPDAAKDLNFDNGGRLCDNKYNAFYIRPVLALEVECQIQNLSCFFVL